jgi:hypothetical protein
MRRGLPRRSFRTQAGLPRRSFRMQAGLPRRSLRTQAGLPRRSLRAKAGRSPFHSGAGILPASSSSPLGVKCFCFHSTSSATSAFGF